MLQNVLVYLGLACVAAIIVLSVETRFYLRRRGAEENAHRAVLRRMGLRTVLVVAALLLFVLSHVLA